MHLIRLSFCFRPPREKLLSPNTPPLLQDFQPSEILGRVSRPLPSSMYCVTAASNASVEVGRANTAFLMNILLTAEQEGLAQKLFMF